MHSDGSPSVPGSTPWTDRSASPMVDQHDHDGAFGVTALESGSVAPHVHELPPAASYPSNDSQMLSTSAGSGPNHTGSDFPSSNMIVPLDPRPTGIALVPDSERRYNPTTPSHRRTRENRKQTWLWATLPLALHFVTVFTVTALLTTYVDGNDFSLQSRYSLSKFTPLQSDITTLISSGIAITRFLATMWTAAMLWRCVFILMGKCGISLEQIDSLLTWQNHINPCLTSSQGFGLLISMILLAAFPSQLAGPVLTGSITWSSSHRLANGQRVTSIEGEYVGNLSHLFATGQLEAPSGNTWLTSATSGLPSIAWQNSLEDERTMKRVIPSIGHLPINSTLKNVTLPYFAVAKIEWIKDPTNELPADILSNWNFDRTNTFVLIPNTSERHDYSDMISETGIIVGNYGDCNFPSIFGDLPADIGLLSGPPRGTFCLLYGRITYTAGAAECWNCRVSSRLTVQNDSALTVFPSQEAPYAIDMMPMVGYTMVTQNNSLPRTYKNLDGYATELLIRSYTASWTTVRSLASYSNPLSTDIQTPIPTSLANVLWWRVWVWLWLNLLFTLSGLVFVFVQLTSGQELVGNPAIAALLMDTSEVLHLRDRAFCDFSTLTRDDKGIGYLHLTRNQAQGGHRKVEIIIKQ